jgi:hypothetical protein
VPALPTIRAALIGGLLAMCGAVVGPGAMAADRLELAVVVTPKEPKPDVFVLKGQVLDADTLTPAYAKGDAVLQRRNCATCSWFKFKSIETDRDSAFKLHIPDLGPGEKKVCYRVKVPRSSEVKRAVSEHHCIAPIAGG